MEINFIIRKVEAGHVVMIVTKGMRIVKKKIIKNTVRLLIDKQFTNSVIQEISIGKDMVKIVIDLPVRKEVDDLLSIVPNLTQQFNGLDYRWKSKGKRVYIEIGRKDLSSINFNNSYISDSLKLKIPTSFGYTYIDFSDGASCHLLNGGTTRMGKTYFLLYLTTLMYLQNQGNISLYITSAKIKDYYPFINVPNVTLSKTHEDMIHILDTLITEYRSRDTLLNTPALLKATDAKTVLKYYPDKYHLFRPIFLVIDEFARFADNKEIQKKVTELVETAGFVNIHVIIASQRPDAKTVLKPRIKANLLCRICFTTTDKNNSLLILDREGAEKLGKIPGRAILQNTDSEIVQIPKMDAETSFSLLTPYRKEVMSDEQKVTRSTNNTLANKIQNLFKESYSDFTL